ncbi:aminoacyl-tRNA hydrolase [bacterium]|nr:aminoacyl-tRNA hydrolase [bacterium]MBU1653109.1 aminoacyl-tRNA hydrolase [bacterium]MBU1882302.1 aminoacyl-tRNA hydrolase [bacterium]
MQVEIPILVVAGLGNPGRKYAETWHNLGFVVLDYWAQKKNLTFKPGRGDYASLEVRSPQGVITFIKPSSFMNLSGFPVSELMRYRKLSPENLLVVCDDIALPWGTLRVRQSGSDAGHNGLGSVIAQIGSENIARLRIGIFQEGWPGDLKDYVLSKIPKSMHEDLQNIIEKSAAAIDAILYRGLTAAMNGFNRHYLNNNINGE